MTEVLPSFQARLALRFGATVLAVTALVSAFGYLGLRTLLGHQLDDTLLRLAEIEAAAAVDSAGAAAHFHDAAFLVEEPGHQAVLSRYGEIWSRRGEPVARTGNLGKRNLPLAPETRRRVLESGKAEFSTVTWEHGTYRSLAYPLRAGAGLREPHLLQLMASAEPVRRVLAGFLKVLSGLVVAGTVAGSAIGWWIAGSAVRPTREIIAQAEAVDMNAGNHRITVDAGTEEMGRLVRVLNSMLSRIDAAFGAQRRFLADAGHEIRTPLTILRGDLEVALLRERTVGEYATVLGQAVADLKDASTLADDLVTLARSDSGDLRSESQTVHLKGLLERVTRRYAGAAAEAGIAIDLYADDDLAVEGEPDLLERAVGNLVDNAIKYAGPGKHVRVSTRAAADAVEVQVADDGPGIPADDLPRLFERFYRGSGSRKTARGSGLGLAILAAVVEEHGGAVNVSSSLGSGTTFTITLPRSGGSPTLP